MPAKTERRHRQGQESRQRILDAALALAVERGYDGTTMALVTERAELPASSVYWQFRNKDELLAEALDHSYRRWRVEGPTWQAANYAGTARQRIRSRLGHSMSSVAAELAYWRLGLTLALLRRPGGIAAQDRFIAVRGQTRANVVDWWAGLDLDAAARDPKLEKALAAVYLAFVDGVFLAHRADPHLDLSALADVAAEAFADVFEQRVAEGPRPTRRLPRRRRAVAATEEEDSRSRLLAAAAEIAAEQGYRGTTISRVCARAELPVSSLYWFFTDKDELLAEVVTHSWDEWYAQQPRWDVPDDHDQWPQALTRILDDAVRSLVDAPSFLRIGHMLTLEGDSDVAARGRFLEVRTRILVRIRDWFAAVLPPESASGALPALLATMVVAFTDGYFLGVQIDGREPPVSVFVDLVVGVIVRAAEHGPSRG